MELVRDIGHNIWNVSFQVCCMERNTSQGLQTRHLLTISIPHTWGSAWAGGTKWVKITGMWLKYFHSVCSHPPSTSMPHFGLSSSTYLRDPCPNSQDRCSYFMALSLVSFLSVLCLKSTHCALSFAIIKGLFGRTCKFLLFLPKEFFPGIFCWARERLSRKWAQTLPLWYHYNMLRLKSRLDLAGDEQCHIQI